MKKFLLILLMLSVQFAPISRASAGMVVFDPTTNKTLMAIWTKLVSMYTLAKQHLDTAVEIENMASDANSTYQTITNLDIKQIADDFKSGDVFDGTGPFGKLGVIQFEVEDKVSRGQDNVDYAVAQKNRIQNLRRLAKLKSASLKNMGKASKDLKARDSGQITAQSTATLAALATMDENRKEQAALAEAKAKKDRKRSMRGMTKIYKAMGKK